MQKESVLAKLRAEQAQVEHQLEEAQHQQQRLQNRLDYYSKGERSKRTHRLITRGAAIEHILPEVKNLDEKSFFILMAEIFIRPDIAEYIHSYLASQASGE